MLQDTFRWQPIKRDENGRIIRPWTIENHTDAFVELVASRDELQEVVSDLTEQIETYFPFVSNSQIKERNHLRSYLQEDEWMLFMMCG